MQLDHFGFRWRGRRSWLVEISLRKSKLRNFGGFGNRRGLGDRCRLGFERRRGFLRDDELSRRLGGSLRRRGRRDGRFRRRVGDVLNHRFPLVREIHFLGR